MPTHHIVLKGAVGPMLCTIVVTLCRTHFQLFRIYSCPALLIPVCTSCFDVLC